MSDRALIAIIETSALLTAVFSLLLIRRGFRRIDSRFAAIQRTLDPIHRKRGTH